MIARLPFWGAERGVLGAMEGSRYAIALKFVPSVSYRGVA